MEDTGSERTTLVSNHNTNMEWRGAEERRGADEQGTDSCSRLCVWCVCVQSIVVSLTARPARLLRSLVVAASALVLGTATRRRRSATCAGWRCWCAATARRPTPTRERSSSAICAEDPSPATCPTATRRSSSRRRNSMDRRQRPNTNTESKKRQPPIRATHGGAVMRSLSSRSFFCPIRFVIFYCNLHWSLPIRANALTVCERATRARPARSVFRIRGPLFVVDGVALTNAVVC